jgi:hypothetical protein
LRRRKQEDVFGRAQRAVVLAPRPSPGIAEANWLPSPDGKPFSLTFCTYVPKDIVKDAAWFPPAVSHLD